MSNNWGADVSEKGIQHIFHMKYNATVTKCPSDRPATHIKAVLRNQSDTEQRPADETAAQALKYYLPPQKTSSLVHSCAAK